MRIAALALLSTVAFAADPVPAWVRDAAKQSTPSYPSKVTAVVLLQEENLTVAPDGQRTMRERGIIRVIHPGSAHITAFRAYNAKSGRIRDIQAWLLSPAGKETVFKKDQIADTGLSDETRAKSIQCPTNVEPGSVFAYEFVEEEKTVFTQYSYRFRESMPVLSSRFSLTLPPGWEVKPAIFNHAPIEPQVTGSTQTWELRNLPWIEPEEYSPGSHAVVPRLGITLFPGSNSVGLRAMKDWTSVSSWVSDLMESPAAVTDTITAKAADLTKNASSEFDKIRSLAEFVQQTNYISVQLNLNKGGGYTPHAAADVLKKNFGDCKDKATLLRSLLKAAGIESWPVTIFSGERRFVRPEWASPLQFNHAIIAIRVAPSTTAPAVLDHPRLGRLLFFDPTDPKTKFGDLPIEEQGSHALVLAGDKGELVQAPMLPAIGNRVETDVEGLMDPNSGLSAKLQRRYFGQSAPYMRSRSEDPKELRSVFERSFTRRLGGVNLTSVKTSENADHLAAQVDFEVNQFGQMLQGRLLMIRPGALTASNDYGFTAKERKLPIEINARIRKDTVRVMVPAGFTIDELPEPIQLETAYGKYRATWTAQLNAVLFEQTVEIPDVLAPASEYSQVRDFFDRLASGQQSAVVLIKR